MTVRVPGVVARRCVHVCATRRCHERLNRRLDDRLVERRGHIRSDRHRPRSRRRRLRRHRRRRRVRSRRTRLEHHIDPIVLRLLRVGRERPRRRRVPYTTIPAIRPRQRRQRTVRHRPRGEVVRHAEYWAFGAKYDATYVVAGRRPGSGREVGLLPARSRFVRERHTPQNRTRRRPQRTDMVAGVRRRLVEPDPRYQPSTSAIETNTDLDRTRVQDRSDPARADGRPDRARTHTSPPTSMVTPGPTASRCCALSSVARDRIVSVPFAAGVERVGPVLAAFGAPPRGAAVDRHLDTADLPPPTSAAVPVTVIWRSGGNDVAVRSGR